MAELTPNYNLEKQQGNDYINIEGINGNFDTIDTTLKQIEDSIIDISAEDIKLQDGKTIEEKFIEVEGDLETHQTDDTAHGVNNKIDKVAGKGLSTNDYTATEKNKLAGIAAGAQVNAVTSVAGRTGAVELTKTDVGLPLATNKDLTNVDNVKQMPYTYGNIVTISASTTLGTAHADRVLDCTNSATITITVPTTLDIGTQIIVIRRGAGTVTFAPASGATLNSKDTKRAIAGQHASATLVKVASTIWQLIGALE